MDIDARATIISKGRGSTTARQGASRKLGVTLGEVRVVITGAGGRIGRLLRRAWAMSPPPGLLPLWSGRGEGFDIPWDIGASAPPRLAPGWVVLHLAARLGPDTPEARAQARLLARAIAEAAAAGGAAALLAASSAAVYAPSARPATEDDAPAPVTANGRLKAATEAALSLACRDAGLRLCHLRIGNVPGADALFGPRAAGSGPIRLDPVPGRDSGPVRSWIGPESLARALAALCRLAGADTGADTGAALPPALNLAQDPPLGMAALLRASGLPWSWAPPTPDVIPDAVMDTARLGRLCPLPRATPAALIAERRRLSPEAPP
jgi:nucleoside-diphosphate-sugar epimerase